MRLVAWVHGVIGVHNAGSEHMLHELFAWMFRQGHFAAVYGHPSMFPNGPFIRDGVSYAPYSEHRQAIFEETDVIFSHYRQIITVTKWAREVRRPVVHLVHNPSNFRSYSIDTGDIDLGIMNSYSMVKQARAYSGAVMTLYPPVPKPPKLPKTGNRVTLINVNNNKGGPLFWKIAQAMPDVEFLAVKGVYPVDQQKCLNLPNVKILENQSDMGPVYADTGLLLIPSDHEAWGRVAVEAMWNEIPMIANSQQRWPGFFECVGDLPLWAPRTNDGPEDVQAWVSQIRHALEDEVWRTDATTRGLRRAEFIEKETTKQLHALERQLLALVNKQSMARVVAFGAEPQYIDHVSASLHQLHPDRLAPMVVPTIHAERALRYGHAVINYPEKNPEVVRHGINFYANPNQSIALVASKTDQRIAQKWGFPVVRCEHGAGQTYVDGDASGSYAGSKMHQALFAYHAPGIHPHRQQRINAPTVLAQRVGCPWLDYIDDRLDPKNVPNSVGFAFHWDNDVRPETARTWDYWLPGIAALAKRTDVVLTCHPRDYGEFADTVRAMGIRCRLTSELAEMHCACGVFCADNTSALFLMAALGHPVVVLNHPNYRQNVNHGLRFWDAADVGIPCWAPDDLSGAIQQARACEPDDMAYRADALRWVFYRTTGASVVEALLLESYLDFLSDMPVGHDVVWVTARRSLALGSYGNLERGRNYLIPKHLAEPLIAKGSATVAKQPEDIRKITPRYGVPGMAVKRDELDHLCSVKTPFEHDGVQYKKGDLVVVAKIPEELRAAHLSKYAPKRRTMEEIETK